MKAPRIFKRTSRTDTEPVRWTSRTEKTVRRTPRTDTKPVRRTPRTDTKPVRRTTLPAGQAPRWVTWFTDIGRPLSAIVVMVLCAPGERHLAELAGWGPKLSWGMAGLLVMYAGIAAVVATIRPTGAPGKRTAVLGAILSLLLAMAAQPVSHYFVTGWMTAEPRPPFWLVTVVSCVPPFVMGHLLHLAADPAPRTTEAGQPDETPRPYPEADTDIPWTNPATWSADMAEEPDTRTYGQPPDEVDDLSVRIGQQADSLAITAEEFNRTFPSGYADTDVRPSPRPSVRPSVSGSELSGWIRDKWNAYPDMTRTDVREAVRQHFPDIKADTVRKAVTRTEQSLKEAIRT